MACSIRTTLLAMKNLPTAGLLAVALLIGSCGGFDRLSSPHSGRTTVFYPGVPNFDLETAPVPEGVQAGLDVYIGIPPATLSFRKQDEDLYLAVVEYEISIFYQEGEELLHRSQYADTLRVLTFEGTRTFDAPVFVRRQSLEPGPYLVRVALRDAHTEKHVTRQRRVEVPAVDAGPRIAAVILAKERDGEPIVSLHVPADGSRLGATVHLAGFQPDTEATVALEVVRVRYDDTAALPPYGLTPMRGSLRYQGYRFGDSEVVDVLAETISTTGGRNSVAFELPPLEAGLYQLLATASGGSSGDVSGSREVVVRQSGFPRMDDIDDMVDALGYIATAREMREIRAAADTAEMKERFDGFWRRLVSDNTLRPHLVRLYYERIAEANLFFSSHKDGWKTDRGMVYVVLGPPLHIDQMGESEVWRYTYLDTDQTRIYVFERIRSHQAGRLFDNYILQRSPHYDIEWARAVERWRDARVLGGW
jgi:GWxTD domain-containing protein